MSDLMQNTTQNISKLMRNLAREIAYDIIPLEDILKNHKITSEQWETISGHHQFQGLLREAVEDWAGAGNAQARVKLKVAAGVEESLEEMFMLLQDPNFPGAPKIELFKTLLQAGGMRGGDKGADGGADGRVSITINMGDAGEPVRVEAAVRAPIDYEGAEDAD